MKTRRKSKAVAAAATAQESEEDENNGSLAVKLPSDMDVDALEEALPESINITNPSADNIISLYRALQEHISNNAQLELDLQTKSAALEKTEVELDQAYQDRERLGDESNASLENTVQELERVKVENINYAAAESSFKAEIANLKSALSASAAENDNLKQRVEDTEREKRDLVGVVSRLKQEGSQRDDEIQSLRTNLKEARQEHQALEATVRELRSTETSTKFKLETLTQQLQLAQSESQRSSAELASQSTEFAKYRRTKHAELTQLQSAHDALTQSHASTQSTLKSLQSTHSANQHQLTQTLAKVQSLQGQLAEQEATYTNEVAGLKRLVGMMEEREKQAKEIVENIEREWAEVGERAERREGKLQDEIDKERNAREEAERRVDQLEGVLDRMGRGELPMPDSSFGSSSGFGGFGVGTPRSSGTAGDASFDAAMMHLSPTVAMASKAQRSGKTFTEVYAEYVRLQDDYARKSAEYDHMDRTLSAVLAQIEERAPILSQQRSEYERLQSEASQLASQLSQAIADRDAQATLAHTTTAKLATSERENALIQKQLADLGRQVQSLLRELARRDDPSLPSDSDLPPDPHNNNNNTNNTGEAGVPAENIEAVITNHLVLFSSIPSLQAQNQKLLRLIRELGEKMEGEERGYRAEMEREQAEAVREAHEAMVELGERLEREKRSGETLVKAYVKERDALKAMLARAERGLCTHGGSTAVAAALTNEGMGGDGDGDGDGGVQRQLLSEVQAQFDTYKTEVGADSARLRDEVVASQREVGQLGAALAKANAKIEYLTDRHRMSQDQFAAHTRSLEDLTTRNTHLFQSHTRLELDLTRTTEDLHTALARVEQLRNEAANLRAEKGIWESVQGRLVEENRILSLERSGLSDLMANVQRMHNELERSGEGEKRRLEGQVGMLEGQIQDLRAQVVQERDAVRHVTLQKDIEVKDLQNRLDKSAQELAKTRESLIGAQTSKQHFESRAEELTRQLQGNEEKLAVYERRSSSSSNGAGANAYVVNEELSKEGQLEAEVAELRSSLKVAEVDLASARANVAQFREISQANELALGTTSTTFDEYKSSTEAQIARQESEYTALKEQLQSTQAELERLRTAHAEIQKTLETDRAAWLSDKKTLEDTIVDMSTSEKNSDSDRYSRESEVRHQEERAKAVEERYSNEVLAHAESIKALDTLKRQLSTLQSKAREHQTAAETAAAKLASSEGSWKLQKEALDQEVAGLNARCKDLSAQNGILLGHLESVTTQAAKIRLAADASSAVPAPEGEGAGGDADTKAAELMSVVAYLRKEKEIVDLQLELAKQENVRLKAQIEHLSHNLEETRATLTEEREKAADNVATEAQHAELIERINQLNILRESNATLRAEGETHAKRARELDAKLRELSKELEPAKEQAAVAQAELDARDTQLKRLEEENRKWQERSQQLLSKYDRIDPAEVQALKDEIAQLKSDAEMAETERVEEVATKAARIEALEGSLRQHKESTTKNFTNFKARLGAVNGEKSALKEQLNALTAERDALLTQKTTLEAAKPAQAEQDSVIASLKAERDGLLAERANWVISSAIAPTGVSEDATSAWEAEKAALIKARDDAAAEAKSSQEAARKAAEEVRNYRLSSDKYAAKIADLTKARAADADRAAAQKSAAVEEALKNAVGSTSTSSSIPEDVAKRHAEELAALQAKLEAEHKAQLEAAVENASKNTISTAGLSQEEAIAAAINAYKEEAKATHAQEIAAAMESGRMEAATKSKLKDAQVVKAQKKVKDLELQILEWRKAGVLNELPPPPVSGGSTTTTTPTATKPTPTGPASASTSTAAGAPVVRKQSLTTRPRGAAPPQVVVPQRAAGLAIRGAAPGRGLPTRPGAPVGAVAAAGVSIMGAAGKRPRESEGGPSSESLAKRLKPAEPATKPGPVSIRRPPPGPPS